MVRPAKLCAAVVIAMTPALAEAEPEVIVSLGGGGGGPADMQTCLDRSCNDIVIRRSGLLGIGVVESVGHFRASLRFDSTVGSGDAFGATSGLIGSVGLSAGPAFVELGLGLGVNWMSETTSRDAWIVSPSVHSALGVRVTNSFALVARVDALAWAPMALVCLEWTAWRPATPPDNAQDVIAATGHRP